MKSSPVQARILVATDNADDARQIAGQLAAVFENVRTSANPANAVADFEACKPDVLAPG